MSTATTTTKVPQQMQTIKEAFNNVSNWKPQPIEINKWSGKKESPILFNKYTDTVIQVGTEKHPMYCPFGVSRWVPGGQGKYKTVNPGEGVEWATTDAQQDTGGGGGSLSSAGRSGAPRPPGGKLNTLLAMNDHNKPGTQGYYLYNFIMGVHKNCIDALVNGVPDESKRDERGQPKIVQLTTLPTAASSKEQLKSMFEMILQPPIRQEGEYSPNLKMKVRFNIVRGAVQLKSQVFDHGREGTARLVPVSTEEQLQLFKPASRGVFVFKINPLQFIKPTEITMTIDIERVTFIRTESAFQVAQFRMNDDDEEEENGATTAMATDDE